ncbi:MAG TPA: D-TA family PLP-dependent enzyme [Nocardioidaceae bacterium]|nr:D-TA family PLP-dependent enzyme [Nocardioidaceae bacterium]
MALPHDLATPTLVVDLDILDRNLRTMADHAATMGVALRPHAKTHKCVEVARRQLRAGATGLTVATVAEAEIFAAAGFDDLFIAYPLWVDHAKGRRLRELAGTVSLTIGIDSPDGARALAAQLGEDLDRVGVLVEVDSGQHRTGVPPEEAGTVADQARHAGLDVRGVFTFPGHSYSPGRPEAVATEEASALEDAAGALRAAGIEPHVVSGGSTPSARFTGGGALTEIRPGVYPFGDAQQVELGTCTFDQVALSALATVVSHAGGAVVLDAGSKALGADRPGWTTGFGRLLDHPDARVAALSEHHSTVTWAGSPLPELGEKVRVVPNHVCNAVNLADELVVAQDGHVVDQWPVDARGANS